MLMKMPHNKTQQSRLGTARGSSSVAAASSLKSKPCSRLLQARKPARTTITATSLHGPRWYLATPHSNSSIFCQFLNMSSSKSRRLSSSRKSACPDLIGLILYAATSAPPDFVWIFELLGLVAEDIFRFIDCSISSLKLGKIYWLLCLLAQARKYCTRYHGMYCIRTLHNTYFHGTQNLISCS
jgi:hypothetical protein